MYGGLYGNEKLELFSEPQVDKLISKYEVHFKDHIDAVNLACCELSILGGWSYGQHTLRTSSFKRGALGEKVVGAFCKRNIENDSSNGKSYFEAEAENRKSQFLCCRLNDVMPSVEIIEKEQTESRGGYKSVIIRLHLAGMLHASAYIGWALGRKGFTIRFLDIHVENGVITGIVPDRTRSLPDFIVNFLLKG